MLVEIDLEDFGLLIGMASSHVEDISSGLEDGSYEATENEDFTAKEACVERFDSLLESLKAKKTGCNKTDFVY